LYDLGILRSAIRSKPPFSRGLSQSCGFRCWPAEISHLAAGSMKPSDLAICSAHGALIPGAAGLDLRSSPFEAKLRRCSRGFPLNHSQNSWSGIPGFHFAGNLVLFCLNSIVPGRLMAGENAATQSIETSYFVVPVCIPYLDDRYIRQVPGRLFERN